MPKLLYTDPYDSNKTIIEYPSFIQVTGGDGTLLTAINDYYDLKKPFYGIAGGTVNFLMNKEDRVAEDAVVLDLPVLKAEVTLRNGTSNTIYAFNDFDIGIHRGWAEFICTHKDNQLGSFKGAGVVISTAAGSTGTNKNNGGPILALDSKRWAITGTQTTKRISTVVRPTGLHIKCISRKPLEIGADGDNVVLADVIEVAISHGGSIQLIVNDLEELQEKRQ